MKEVLKYNNVYQSKSMQEGLMKEEEILKDYIALRHEQGHSNLVVNNCGFFISKSDGFLGASPDGLVNDPSVQDAKGLAEVKFVQVREDESFVDSLLRKGICVENGNQITLNTKHQYYFQVQQQMFVTQRKWTDFVVKGSIGNDIFCERVFFSISQWNNIFTKLKAFYDRWIVIELA